MNPERHADLVLRRIAAMCFAACGFAAVAIWIPVIVFFATKP